MGRMRPLYDEIKMNCTIVSDTHIDEKHPMPWVPKHFLKSALRDARRSAFPVDVFLTVGDTTSRSSETNWKMTKDCFDKVPNSARKIILPLGNHDTWNDNGFKAAIRNYKKYYERICGNARKKTYFTYVINGYHMIFLGTDSESGCEASLSDEQIKWFENEMNNADNGKPIFVFCHQSLNQKHGLPVTWDKSGEYDNLSDGGIGEKSDEIEAILKKHKNVFFFSGHSHMGLGGEKCKKENGFASIEDCDGLTLINLPSLACGNHHGEDKSLGIGIQLEVYEDAVILRPRNFSKHRWNRRVKMKDGKPYYEVELV